MSIKLDSHSHRPYSTRKAAADCVQLMITTDVLASYLENWRFTECGRSYAPAKPQTRRNFPQVSSSHGKLPLDTNFELDDILSNCMDESGDIVTHIAISIVKLRGFPVTNGW